MNIEKQERQALRQLLSGNGDKFRITKNEEEYLYEHLNRYNVKYANIPIIQTYIVSSDTDELFNAVKESLKDLRETVSHEEWKNCLTCISGADEDDSMDDIVQAVITEYGYGHELASYDNNTFVAEVNGKQFYIMRID